MAAAMLALAGVTLSPPRYRARVAALVGLGIAAASPLVSGIDWSRYPDVVRDYLAAGHGRFASSPSRPTSPLA